MPWHQYPRNWLRLTARYILQPTHPKNTHFLLIFSGFLMEIFSPNTDILLQWKITPAKEANLDFGQWNFPPPTSLKTSTYLSLWQLETWQVSSHTCEWNPNIGCWDITFFSYVVIILHWRLSPNWGHLYWKSSSNYICYIPLYTLVWSNSLTFKSD